MRSHGVSTRDSRFNDIALMWWRQSLSKRIALADFRVMGRWISQRLESRTKENGEANRRWLVIETGAGLEMVMIV